MKMTQRARRATLAVLAATAIGGSGVAVGAATAAPAATTPRAASTVPAITSAPAAGGTSAAASSDGRASYADVVRQVLPSVVLISTSEGLGSGIVLDQSGDIVTNAHVAGNASTFKVQVPGDAAPRTASLVGSYPPDDLAVIRVTDPSGLQPARFGDSAAAQAGDVVLAAIAARTSRIHLGSAVTVLSSDDPVRVFQRYSTLNAISGGRAEVILGRGSSIDSFPLFGTALALPEFTRAIREDARNLR